MKQGWEIKKLGEVASFFRGLTYSKGDETELSNKKVLRSNNVDLETNSLVFDDMKYLREDFVIDEDKIVKPQSILICMSNGSKSHIGKVAFIAESMDYAFGGFMGLIYPHPTVCAKYVFYSCVSPLFKHFLAGIGNGIGITNLRFTDLAEFSLPIPSLAEQERIVEVLDREFEKIDAMKANAEQNLQHAKDLFQAALRQELQPKEGWETKTIGEIAELKGGKRVPKGYKLEITPTGYPYIRVADFNDNGSVDLDDIHYISKEVFEGIKRYIITTNDVYISIAGTIGKSGIIPEELNGANLTENACRLVFKEVVDKKYIYYCTISSDFNEQIIKLTMQAAQPKLALARLATATLNLPSVESQRKIVARLDILNERCKALEENYKKTIALCDDMKQALLRKAFSGEL